MGSDLNPLAVALTSAKVRPPNRKALERRLRELRANPSLGDVSTAPPEIRMIFSRETLQQLLWLKDELRSARQTDAFIVAILLGMLHMNADSDGKPRGLSIAMPNTFAMSPAYVKRYIREHGLRPPKVDVLEAVQTRAMRFLDAGLPPRQGKAWIQDATVSSPEFREKKARLIFTSPPYLQVIKYGKYNWIRLWFLNESSRAVDGSLFASASQERYCDFMCAVARSASRSLTKDGFLCLVIGDVRRQDADLNLARQVKEISLEGTDLTLLGQVTDAMPVGKKVSRIWGSNKGRATRTDRILVLGRERATLPPRLERLSW